MLKPKQLNEFLDKTIKLFPSIKNILYFTFPQFSLFFQSISNPDGSLIASTSLS